MRPKVLLDLEPLKRSGPFRRLWTSSIVNILGTQLTAVAVPYQTFRITHSSLDVGLVSMGQLLPLLGGSLFGGVLADSKERRRLLIAAQAVMGLASAGLALNTSGWGAHLWPIFALTALSAAFSGIDSPTRWTLVSTMVERELLASANALWQLLLQVGIVVGPAVAGLLLGHFSISLIYWLDVGTFYASIAIIATLPKSHPPERTEPMGAKSLIDGFGFLKGRQVLQANFVVDLDAMVFGMPRALFPALGLVRFHGGAEAVGLLYAAPGAGALLGALFTGWVHRIHRQGLAVLLAVAAWGGAITLFGLSPWLVPALLLLALAGAADVVSAVFRNVILQSSVPENLRGRLSAIHIAVVTGGPRLGDFESGAAAQLVGPEASVVSGGLLCLAGVGAIWRLMPHFARYRDTMGKADPSSAQ